MLSVFTVKQKDFFFIASLTMNKKFLDFLSKLGLAEEFLNENCSSPEMTSILKIIKDMLEIVKIAEKEHKDLQKI